MLCFRYKASSSSSHPSTSYSHHSNSNSTDAMDIEVAMTTGAHSAAMSRDSSMGSYSDTHSRGVTETPSEDFSNDSDFDASSPIEIVT